MDIKYDKKSLIVNGERKYLISGEFHYFRVPRSDWERRMKLFLATGGNCIATYVPWIIHERVEGEIVFDDCDERALTDFLTLAHKLGLMVILRPGPYQYSELKHDGLPEWLVKNYPELLAKDINGTPFRSCSVSYLHPTLLEKTKKYYKAFADVVRPFIDKNVAMVQLDNELTGIHVWFGSLDYNPDSMGFGKTGGRYPLFLEKKYGNIEAINEALGTTLTSFEEAHPSLACSGEFGKARLRKDYFDFYTSTIAEFGMILKGYLREFGIEGMVCHNSANRNMIASFTEFMEEQGDECLLGYDNYYTLNYSWAQNNITPQYFARTIYGNDALKCLGQPPMVLEMPGGSPSEVPPILPADLYTCYMTNLAAGMKGVNYYIYTGGKNPEGAGEAADIYDYCAFVSADGTIKDTFESLDRFNTFVSSAPELTTMERFASVSVGFEWENMRSANYMGSLSLSHTPSVASKLETCVIYSLMSSKYSGEYVELSRELDTSRPLIISGGECMSKEAQQNVVDFIKKGGRLLLLTTVPYMDFEFRPCTVLRDFINEDIVPFKFFSSLTIVKGRRVYGINKLSKVNVSPLAQTIATDEEGNTVGFEKTLGDGKVIFLGGNWLAGTTPQFRMLEDLLASLDARPDVLCSNPAIQATLFTDRENTSVFLLNLYTGKQSSNIKVYDVDSTDDSAILLDTDVTLEPMEVRYIKIK